MKRTTSFNLWAAVTLITLSQAALASGDDAKVIVTPLPSTATLSGARVNYAAYDVNVQNVSSDETLKILKLTGSTKVTLLGVATTHLAKFFASSGQPCVATNSDLTAVECTIDETLAPGQSLNFVVIFTTPNAPAGAADRIKFATRTKYLEYESGETYSESEDIESISKTGFTALAAANAENVNTYLPASAVAQTVFTGAGATPNANAGDRFTTSVTVPTTTGTTAAIVETTPAESCAAVLNQCFNSLITLADVSIAAPPFLKIALRFDATAIGSATTTTWLSYYKPKPPNIKNLVIEYSVDGNVFVQVLNCPRDYYGVILPGFPSAGVPCIAKRTAFGKYVLPVADRGDWLIDILAVDNGLYRTR